MLKRDQLETMLRKITDKQFNAIWRETYGYIPFGDRADLVADFVAEQYDGELDGCIKRAESLLKSAPKRESTLRSQIRHPNRLRLAPTASQ